MAPRDTKRNYAENRACNPIPKRGLARKIMMVGSRYTPHLFGGGEISLASFARGLSEAGNEIVVVTTHPEAKIAEELIDGIRVIRLPIKNLYWPMPAEKQSKLKKLAWHMLDIYNPWMASMLEKLIAQENPDIVQTHSLEGFSVSAWTAARGLNTPVVHYVHSYYLMCPRATMFENGQNCPHQCGLCRLITSPLRLLSSCVTAVIYNSSFVLKTHENAGYFRNVEKSGVIYGACEGRSAIPTKPASNTLRLGFLGRLDPSKGLEWLFFQLRQIPAARWELYVAGNGIAEYEESLHKAAEGMPIHFLGHRPAAELFDDIDLLLVPSLWNEPQGRIVFEAYASGVPVAVANRGGLPELVKEGVTGYVFNPQSDELVEILERLSRDPSELHVMSVRALEQAKAHGVAEIGKTMSTYLDGLRQQTYQRTPIQIHPGK